MFEGYSFDQILEYFLAIGKTILAVFNVNGSNNDIDDIMNSIEGWVNELLGK